MVTKTPQNTKATAATQKHIENDDKIYEIYHHNFILSTNMYYIKCDLFIILCLFFLMLPVNSKKWQSQRDFSFCFCFVMRVSIHLICIHWMKRPSVYKEIAHQRLNHVKIDKWIRMCISDSMIVRKLACSVWIDCPDTARAPLDTLFCVWRLTTVKKMTKNEENTFVTSLKHMYSWCAILCISYECVYYAPVSFPFFSLCAVHIIRLHHQIQFPLHDSNVARCFFECQEKNSSNIFRMTLKRCFWGKRYGSGIRAVCFIISFDPFSCKLKANREKVH